MPTTPIAGLPSPDDTSPNAPWLHFDSLNAKLDPLVTPHFDTTTERNNAYAAWVTAGGTMKAGLLCSVAGVIYRSTGTSTSAWERVGNTRGAIQSFTTSGAGDVLITHGLGVTPAWANVDMAGVSSASQYGKAVVTSVTSTVISARVHDTRDGSALTGFPVSLSWSAGVL